MAGILSSRKAPSLRLILAAGAFLVFIPLSFSQYNFDHNCRQAYEAILTLRFSDAHRLISDETKSEPGNLIPVYLENYIDFLTLVIGEERDVYNQLRYKKGMRVRMLEKGNQDSPFYNFCLGEVHLQWALARLKFGDFSTAALEIHRANTLFTANVKKYPAFTINQLGLGLVHVMVGLVPDNYRWISNLVGLHGSVELGLKEIRQVAEYSGPDKITMMFKTQATFYLALLTLNLQGNKRNALPVLDLLNEQTGIDQQLKSPLMVYARATILMKNGFNDDALVILQGRTLQPRDYKFQFLDYIEGVARLNKLDYSASDCFRRFITGFKGRNYIRSAYQKLAWIAMLQGDSAGYYRTVRHILTLGESDVDEDKQAGFEAANGPAPNPVLLRARLLFDGGYYNRSLVELLSNSVKTVVKSKRDLVEYFYRLGRIYHETGNFEKAIENYRKTLLHGKSEPFYFASGAAYQLGLLYENTGAYAKADSAYYLCLSIKTEEYRTTLHQKARAGLNRIKTVRPKT